MPELGDDVDEAEGRGVLEQDGEGVAAFEDRPVGVSAVAEAAVLGVDEVQLPQSAFAAGDSRGSFPVAAHGGEQVVDGDPLVARVGGEGGGDGLAAGLDRGEDVRGSLAFDLVDQVELVEQGGGDPGSPELPDRRGGRLGQGGASAVGELEPAAGKLGQSARLQEQRPRERRDRLAGVEVAAVEHVGDGCDARGGSAVRLAAPQSTGRHELQHGVQVGPGLRGGRPDVFRHRGLPGRGVRAGWACARAPSVARPAAAGTRRCHRRVRRGHAGR